MTRTALLAVMLGTSAQLNAQEPTPEPADARPTAPGLNPAGLTPRDVTLIEFYKVEQLQQMMDKAHNTLSRGGMQMLRDRVMLRRFLEKAQGVAQSYEADPLVKRALDLQQSPEAKQELARLLEIRDEGELARAVETFLKERGVTLDSLKKAGAYRSTLRQAERCRQLIDKINSGFAQPPEGLGEPKPEDFLVGGSIDEKLDAIEGRIGDGAVQPTPNEEPKNLRETLAALLGASE